MIKKSITVRLFFFILAIFCTAVAFASVPRLLQELKKPQMVGVSGDRLYVIEGATIFVYSLEDGKLMRTFGKSGEGPGELKIFPDWPISFRIFPGYIIAESKDKLIFFSKEGEVLSEKRKPWESNQFTPVGKHYVAKKYYINKETNTQYLRLVIYDSDFNETKELHREKWFQQYTKKGFQVELFSDYMNFQVCDDKIFVEKSPQGFLIDVYDSEGNKLYSIKKPYKKLSVTEADRTAAVAEFKDDNKGRLLIRRLGSWEAVLKRMTIIFPRFKPVIRNIEIHDGKLYVQTFKQEKGKDEFIVMDLMGNVLRTVYLPIVKRAGFDDKMYGIRYYGISKDKLYYLTEDEETADWQLNEYKIK